MKAALAEIAAAGEKKYTYAGYCKLPEGAPYQLIGGELVVTPAPGTYHQTVLFNLGLEMGNFIRQGNLGRLLFAPVDVYLGETETYQPDIIFIARERMNIIEPQRINGAPDLVVEILSPATAYYDLRKKFKVYERAASRNTGSWTRKKNRYRFFCTRKAGSSPTRRQSRQAKSPPVSFPGLPFVWKASSKVGQVKPSLLQGNCKVLTFEKGKAKIVPAGTSSKLYIKLYFARRRDNR